MLALVIGVVLTSFPGWIQAAPSQMVVVNFDDIVDVPDVDTTLTGTNYAGLIWETGSAGLGGNLGLWVVPSSTRDDNFPRSNPHNVINAWGSTQMGIGFPSLTNVEGAFIAAQGDTPWITGLKVDGYRAGQLVSTTAMFTNIDASPDWFAMNLLNVDRIVFISTPVFFGGGWFGMDDLTYTPIPEPAGLLLTGALAGLVLCRRR